MEELYFALNLQVTGAEVFGKKDPSGGWGWVWGCVRVATVLSFSTQDIDRGR